MAACPSCGHDNGQHRSICTRCQAPLAVGVEPAARPLAPTHVIVTDISMPFWSMVGFMLKWAFATIPAAIVLMFVVGLLLALLGGSR